MQIIFVKRSEILIKNFKEVKKLRQVHEIEDKKSIIKNHKKKENSIHKKIGEEKEYQKINIKKDKET